MHIPPLVQPAITSEPSFENLIDRILKYFWSFVLSGKSDKSKERSFPLVGLIM
jgi:hypothetical protein